MFQFKGFHFNYVGRRGWFVAFSALTVLASLIIITTKGLNFGTDFKGGTNLQFRFSQTVSESTVRKTLDPLNLGGFSVQKIGKSEENRLIVKMEKHQEESRNLSTQVTEALKKNLGADTVTLEQDETVGPKAGADLRKKAELAIIVSWVLILIYIGFRFDFAFAPGAIVALIHDVILALGGFALTGREISLTVVAAILTIIGYSINDTIIIYDRIRENLQKEIKLSFKDIVNVSINEMFPRTIITSFTVFLVVALMYFFGEGEFQNFGFAMIIGVITGVYSTLSVACPLYIWIKENESLFQKLSTQKSS